MNKVFSSIVEAAGFIEEEFGEVVGSKSIARQGRSLRNQGKAEQGKKAKTTKPGRGKLEKSARGKRK